MMAAPETSPSPGHGDRSKSDSTYSCSRGARGSKVSRNTLGMGERSNSEQNIAGSSSCPSF
jgi:hypothetical protein